MSRTTTLLIAAIAIAIPTVSAQSVQFRGKIENGEGACYYCPGFDFVVDCVDAPVSSSVYDLNLYIGMQVDATGVFNGSAAQPIIDITSLQVVAPSFSIGGGASIGGDVKFTAFGTAGDFAMLTIAVGPGLTFLGSSTLFMDLNTMAVLGTGTLNSIGELKVKIPLANDSRLIGLELFGQAAIVPQTGAPFYFTNPDCKVITG